MHYAIRYFIRVVCWYMQQHIWKSFHIPLKNCKPLYVLVEISLFTFSVTIWNHEIFRFYEVFFVLFIQLVLLVLLYTYMYIKKSLKQKWIWNLFIHSPHWMNYWNSLQRIILIKPCRYVNLFFKQSFLQ